MTTYQMNLSTTEPNSYVGIIRVRQYDTESQTFDVTITENGVPVDFTGLTPLFYVRGNPNTSNWISEQKVTEIVDAKNGKLRYTLSHYDMQNLGKNKGYFAFLDLKEDGDVKEKFERTFQYSTKDFSFYVMKSVFSEGIHDSNYIWTFEEMLRYFMEWIKESQNTYDGWYEEAKEELQRIIEEFLSWISSNQDIYDEWLNENKNNFLDWFESIRDILDENAAGNLQNQFDKINPNAEIIKIDHDFKGYPKLRVLYWEYGMSTVPLEKEPTGLGGGNVQTIESAIEYLDRFSLKVKVPRYYKFTNPEVMLLDKSVRMISNHKVLQIDFIEDDICIGTNVAVTTDFKNKVAGNFLLNKNSLTIAYYASHTTTTYVEVDQANIDNFAIEDGTFATFSTSATGARCLLRQRYDAVALYEKIDESFFEGLTTTEQKVNKLRTNLTDTIEARILATGNVGTVPAVVLGIERIDRLLQNVKANNTNSVAEIKTTALVKDSVDTQGFINVVLYTAPATAAAPAQMKADYGSLTLHYYH
ncbi:BppU family phage baseplate upper protein [Enterococcus sp. LJL128]